MPTSSYIVLYGIAKTRSVLRGFSKTVCRRIPEDFSMIDQLQYVNMRTYNNILNF
jgi:hypothetical protein